MSLRYPGGLITKSPTAPTTSAAKGIWTLEQALQYIKAGTWPLSALGDPYFQYNTLLLPGQGTNNTQNNSFQDSSTNNFTVNRSGTPTQGTFTPFSGTAGNWSNYFDGTGDYLTLPDNTALNLETGDFTIELWFYVTTSGVNNPLIYRFDGDASSRNELQFGIVYNSSGNLVFSAFQSTTNDDIPFTGVSINQWHHCALVRSGNNIYAYLDGVRNPTTRTLVGSLNNGGFPTWIGGYREGGTFQYLNGFISNVRILKGTALYTGSTYTVPTAPLTAIANTTLLTCQNNRFVDNSTNAFTLTTNGGVAVTPFQPFGAPTSAYSAATNGGSGYFDGSGDYLTVGNDALLAPGTGAFTWEGWFYWIGGSGENVVWTLDTTGGMNIGLAISSGQWGIGSRGVVVQNTFGTLAKNQWMYLAITRSGTTINAYYNGTRIFTGSNSYDYVSGGTLCLGSIATFAGQEFNGYMSGVRWTKGTALYTGSTMTVPTTPNTTTSGGASATTTELLLDFTNAGIIDNAQDNDLITVADAKISTAQYKWGTSSIFFDGNGDYLSGPSTPALNCGTGDFTIEGWVYISSRTLNYPVIFSNNNGSYTAGAITLTNSSANNVAYNDKFALAMFDVSAAGVPVLASSFTNALNTWYHLSVVRVGTTLKMFVNGSQAASATISSSLVFNWGKGGVLVGGGNWDTTNSYFHGYINDLRLTNGYARYPYSFTPPTAAFPLFWQAAQTPTSDPYFDYTTLLLPGNQPSGVTDTSNNVFKDSSANNFTITRNPASGPNAPTQGTFTPFSQTGWGNFFDGTSDYLTLASSADFNIFGGDMTFECWFYSTAASLGSRSEHLFAFVQDATNRESLYFNGTTLTFWTSSGAGNGPRITYASTPQNQWIHVAVAKSGSTFTMYVNGVSVGTSTTTQYSTSNQSLQIGTYNSAAAGPDSFTGYISNARVVKGTAVYTANFIPSTTPLTAVTNTVLLTCQSNRFVDTNTQTTAKTVTPSGDTSVQAFSPFNPTAAYSAATVGGSGYFDGTGDFLSLTNNAAFNFGSAAFTIELWYYPTTLSGTQCLITNYGGSTTGFVIQMGGSTPGSGRIDAGFSGDGADITSTNAVRLNSWNHIAISGTPGATGIKLFINGAQEGSTYTGATSLDTSSTLLIGEVASTNRLSGYLCGLRLVKGGALYTATFTPPTSPPTTTVSSGTVSLLANFTNGAIIDSTAKNDLETVGNAVISTAQSKFGGSSMFFDGTGDYLKGNAFTAGLTGSGDFTIEGWIYISSLPGAEASICSTTESGGTGIIFGLGSGGNVNKLQIAIGNTSVANPTVVDSATFTTGAWVHFAAVRYSGTIYLFKNGVSVGTPTSASGTLDRQTVTVGAWPSGASTLTGYINDLRITRGIARYTQNFTPPTTAYLTL
jgi:hypothetical protein